METHGQFIRPDGHFLSYRHLKFSEDTVKPGWVFISGYGADMQGAKAAYIFELARKTKTNCLIFEHFGHGTSSGSLLEGTIGRWKEDAIALLDEFTKGPQILVGSSLGGWLMLLMASKRPERIQGMIGIASAPDFTNIYWDSMTQDQREVLMNKGHVDIFQWGSNRTITRNLIEDGRNHFVMGNTLHYPCPVILLHGQKDEIIPWESSQKLLEQIDAPFVSFTLIKNGDHGLARTQDLNMLKGALFAMSSQDFEHNCGAP